jgi:hypothetical protein
MLILGALSVIFTVFTTVFAASAPSSQVRNLPKWVWVVLCLVTGPVGSALYIFLGRPVSKSKPSSAAPSTAPDDNPAFLRDLERKLREQRENGDEA